MKVAKLLLAAAIAAPSLFLTSCEKQIDVQASTMNREATRSLAKPVAPQIQLFQSDPLDAVWTLTAYNFTESCGTGTFQQQQPDGSWVDVSAPLPFNNLDGFITFPGSKPASGTVIRVFFSPTKGKGGCANNFTRSTSDPVTIF